MSEERAEESAATKQYQPNSAQYWYPPLAQLEPDLPVNVPDSEFVEYDFMESLSLVDAEMPDDLPWGEFTMKVGEIGYPAFVRTDQKSVKHAGPGAYRATEPDDIPTILAVLTDHHVKANRHPSALMIREWVNINAQFRAFDGLPIGREYRVFASPNEVHCKHFYWPEEAIEDGRGTPTSMDGDTTLTDDEWRHRLNSLDALSEGELHDLHDSATRAAYALNVADHIDDDTAWSVDFAQDTGGDWWLIDVALAEDSWHPDDCQEVFDQ